MKLPVDYNSLRWEEKREVRNEYINRQKGKCQYCGEPLINESRADILSRKINSNLFPKRFFDYPIHLHHSHDTGLTIGAVHAHCNAFLWQYLGE